MMRQLLSLLLLVSASVSGQISAEDRVRAEAANRAGVALYEAGKPGEAIPHFEEAQRLDPKNAVLVGNLARALHAAAIPLLTIDAKVGEAQRQLRRAMELDPKEILFPLTLSRSLRERGDLAEAGRVMAGAARSFPADPRVFVESARIAYEEERLQQALELLEAALPLTEDDGASFRPFLEKVRREVEVEGRYFAEQRGNFVVKADDESFRGVSREILDLLDSHYQRLGAEFRHWPARRVTLVLYSRGDYDQATGAHGWTGGLFDGKIRLPVRNYRQVAGTIEATLVHELTHFFVRSISSRCPIVLDEGLAQLREGRPVSTADGVVRAALAAGKAIKLADIPGNWATIADGETVRLHYAVALSFTGFLERRYGIGPLLTLVEKLPGRLADDEVWTQAVGRDLATVQRAWLESL